MKAKGQSTLGPLTTDGSWCYILPTTPTDAMRYVRDHMGLRVTLVNPDAKNASPRDLARAATYQKRLWKSHLRRSQLPDILTDEVGTITKPSGW